MTNGLAASDSVKKFFARAIANIIIANEGASIPLWSIGRNPSGTTSGRTQSVKIASTINHELICFLHFANHTPANMPIKNVFKCRSGKNLIIVLARSASGKYEYVKIAVTMLLTSQSALIVKNCIDERMRRSKMNANGNNA